MIYGTRSERAFKLQVFLARRGAVWIVLTLGLDLGCCIDSGLERIIPKARGAIFFLFRIDLATTLSLA